MLGPEPAGEESWSADGGSIEERGCDPSTAWLHGAVQGACPGIQSTSAGCENWRARAAAGRSRETRETIYSVPSCSKMVNSMVEMQNSVTDGGKMPIP